MPLTAFQKEVMRLLAAHRDPESHVGGGAVINRAADSPRYSADLDLFHDLAERVLAAAQADTAILLHHGFGVDWLLRQPFLQRARVSQGTNSLGLDWAYDSAFRFFPVQPDPEFGYCLHPADLGTNKCLALAGRAEIRDFLDIVYLHETYLTLDALAWAACGKDQGFTPWSLLDHAKRNMKFREEDLVAENLVKPLRLTDLKEAWLKATDQAEALFSRLPAAEVGCLYLGPDFQPRTPDPDDPTFPKMTRHFGSPRGAWPKLS